MPKKTMSQLMTDTIRIKPVRVYHCKSENRMMSRQSVWKDHKGNYHCSSCGETVEDKTNTETGQSFIQVSDL